MPSIVSGELTRLKPQVTVETSWTCRACGAVRQAPAHLIVGLQPEDSWSALSELLFDICDSCGQRGAAACATVLVEEVGSESAPSYMLVSVFGTLSSADIERGRSFLAEHRVPPVLITDLVPSGWPPADTAPNPSVLTTLGADPVIASQVARHERRRRVMTALQSLGSVTSPEQIRDTLRACPELIADGIDAERELVSLLRLPPEAACLAEARGALIRVLTSSVTDAELEIAYEAFDKGREAAVTQIAEAAYRKAGWLAGHLGAAATEWDPVAAQALHLLGLAGDERGRAELLDNIGIHIARRPGATQAQVSWAVQCLRDSREQWRGLGDNNREAVAASHLAMALYNWDYGDAYATAIEAEAIMREVVAHYEGMQDTGLLAMMMTNLGIILLKAATIDQRRDRIQEAADLCRRALPLRPKTKDPLGWAFSAANLALALSRLGADDATTRRSHLGQAAAVSQEAAGILDAHGDVPSADQARINRLDALLGLANQLREERLRAAVGGEETDDVRPATIANLLDSNPAAFGLAETPPAVAEIVRGPASPDESQFLKTVLDEAAVLLAEPRVAINPAIRSRLARLTAIAWPELLGPTQEAADAVAAARRLIDETVAPGAAAQTNGLLGSLFTRLNRWAEAAAVFDDDLALNEGMLRNNTDRDRVMQTLARAPTLARWTAYAHVRCGDPRTAVTILERTRSRSLPRFVPGAGRRLELLSWRSATLDDIGRAATPTCPIAYVLTANTGSAVLLVRRGDDGRVGVTAYENSLSAAFFVAHMFSLPQPERGFLTAQMISADMGPAIRSLMEPLGSMLEPVVADLLRDDVRDLILIPAGPTALLPWAAATIRRPEGSQPMPVGELLTLSVAPSAAAVVLGRQRMEGRVRDATAGRLLVIADPERHDTFPLPGTRDEARRIEATFPGRVDVLAGPAARTDTVLDRLPTCWAAHLACHGTSNVLKPQAMRLLLSDGDLTLEQLLQLPELRTRLVVVSACQSGQIDIAQVSDEMLGMPLAFLQAGACTVVSTLWPIDDRVTAMLVGRFYEEFAAEIGVDGRGDVAAALARAQRWLRSLTGDQARRWRQERGVQELPAPPRPVGTAPLPPSAADAPFADPYFWAGIVAYGR
jgi:CHAT domain-containing protein/tetratricopeptide (TPR) repeat protein